MFKKVSTYEVKNNRPINLFPAMSQVIEKLVYRLDRGEANNCQSFSIPSEANFSFHGLPPKNMVLEK